MIKAMASRLPWCLLRSERASSVLPRPWSVIPPRICTVAFSAELSSSWSICFSADDASPEEYCANALTAVKSGPFSLCMPDSAPWVSPLAIWARSLRTRAVVMLDWERDEVSKSRTAWYCPWWKALWIVRSSTKGSASRIPRRLDSLCSTYLPPLRRDPSCWCHLESLIGEASPQGFLK